MSRRIWQAGDEFTECGVRWRIVQGRYFTGDLRLEWHIRGQWVPVKMLLMAIHADFYGQNEDERCRQLYPQGKGYQKYVDWCELAAREGWQAAHHDMMRERAQRWGTDA